jgi:hypothetical protein
MSYKSERDKAAEEYYSPYGTQSGDVETDSFKAGTDWALTSETVKELYRTALNMHSCVSADPCESELQEVEALGRALEAFAQVVKEIE